MRLTQPFFLPGDCSDLSSLRCLPKTTEYVPISVAVATCTGDFECTDTCTEIHIVNHTSCHCSCDLDSRSCKGDQVNHKINVHTIFSTFGQIL